ncbi:MAG TPA: aspartate carbamoyltransferase catalytic subunit [Dehalococcoidia bacterium]|nr:aspartate carbamoyltransferase catalytic subunit [Dehalococcoidia bacterium]
MKRPEPDAGAASTKTQTNSPANNWRHKHILDIDDFSPREISLVFETADAMAEILSREVKKVPTLRGTSIVNLFYEPSTRTRSSFELAAKNLSADVINLDSSKSSVVKGESLINNLQTLQALGAQIIVIRHSQSGAPYLAAQNVDASIINAGDGQHAHPSQALLDLYTMRNHFGQIKGLKVAIIGDILHSRVARSNIWGLNIMGAQTVLCAPPTLSPLNLDQFIRQSNLASTSFEPDINTAVKDADVVIVLRLQRERQQSGLLPTLREYIRMYQLDQSRLSLAKPHAIVMHPGPINEDIEISSEVAHGLQSVINQQVSNGIAVRMALFYLVSGRRIDHAA